MPIYRVMYQYEGVNASHHTFHELPNIRALAKFLNHFVKKNPKCHILMCHISDDQYNIKEPVQFMPHEFEKQQFFTGYKQRLLEWYKFYHVDNPKKGKKKAKTKNKPKSTILNDKIYAVVGSFRIPVEPNLSLDEVQLHVAKLYPYVRGCRPRIQGNEIHFIREFK